MIPNDKEPEEEWRAALSRPLRVHQPPSVVAPFEVELAAASDCGTVQRHNTDHYLAIRLSRLQETLATSLSAGDLPPRFEEYAYVMFVADGLGGEGAGARASRIALSALAHLAIQFGEWNVRIGSDTPRRIIEQSEFLYARAHEAILEERRADPSLADMATSLTAVYIAGTDMFVAHAGHSKAFLFREGVLIQLTTDHTLEQLEHTSPRPRPLDHSKVDVTHVVTESLGGRSGGPQIDVEHLQIRSGDRVLLCTNGLTDVVSEDRIADVLALCRNPRDECRRLVDLALAAGGPDNVTVLAADFTIRRS